MIRAFFGIAIPPDVTQQLLREFVPLQKACQGNLIPVHPNLFHITVKFLNTINPDALAIIANRTHDFVAKSPGFTLHIKKITFFPRPMGRVIAAYIVPDPQLLSLHHALDDIAMRMGVAREGRRYRPHITLGKFSSTPCSLETIRNVDFSIMVKELMLYESKPGSNGSHYIPLRHFPFLK